jgi:C-terminal processing protease CtpA/Prc
MIVSRALVLTVVISFCQMICPLPAPGAAPDSGQSAPASGWEGQYHHAWQIVRDNTLFGERLPTLVDWEHRYDGRLSSKSEMETAINDMVTSFGDDYTYFRNTAATNAYQVEIDQSGVVTGLMLPGGVAYVKIKTFVSRHVAAELQETLVRLSDADGYILDLRDNHGGNIYQAFQCAAMFMDKGKFSTLRGRTDGKRYCEKLSITAEYLIDERNRERHIVLRQPNLTADRPLVVLINKNTRSAAEMLASALREDHRATLVGDRSYGKAVVQRMFILEDGSSLKVAMAWNYPPSGHCYHGLGLEPDIAITNCSATEQMARCLDIVSNQMQNVR